MHFYLCIIRYTRFLMIIKKKKKLDFSIEAPASKSIYHRELIVRFLLGDRVNIADKDGDNEDVLATKACLRALTDLTAERVILPCNESGSTIRFMIPVATAFLLREGLDSNTKELVFTTKGRLFDRPVKELADALSPMGITITKEESDRSIHVTGRLKGGDFTIDGSVSSQYISGLLMALPLFEKTCSVFVTGECKSVHYIELTQDVLAKYGCTAVFRDHTYYPAPDGYAKAFADNKLTDSFKVEGDWSNGAFLLCMKEWSDITVTNLNPDSRQGDKAILEFLKLVTDKNAHPEVTWDCTDTPDIAPYMAVIAPFSFGKTTVTGISRLRIKESDRVKAVREQLLAVGIRTEETDDSLTVYEYEAPANRELETPLKLSSYHDHRMAMCAILLAVILKTEVEIDDTECLKKSFPELLNEYLPKYFAV